MLNTFYTLADFLPALKGKAFLRKRVSARVKSRKFSKIMIKLGSLNVSTVSF
ncbi:hypothetical protein HS7_00360 [Sulfolobales archaeon HS-7]|nr:hypothetical protein HS7_00360 [Sulfolobales archaeon HS-7]